MENQAETNLEKTRKRRRAWIETNLNYIKKSPQKTKRRAWKKEESQATKTFENLQKKNNAEHEWETSFRKNFFFQIRIVRT